MTKRPRRIAPDGLEWSEEGRGVHHRHVARLAGRRLEVARAPSLFGGWAVREKTSEMRANDFGALRPVYRDIAHARDLRAARKKAENILRGEQA